MRAQLYLTYLVMMLAPPLRGSDDASAWLVGSWKSNRELTVATIRLDNPLPPEKRARFENLFGTMTITYTKSEVSFYAPVFEKYPAWSATEPYRIQVASAKRLIIRHKNPRTKKDESTILNFEGPNRYWIDLSLGSTKGVKGREYFDRLPQ